ncbi:MAG: hypothetical protein ACT4QD_16630 [Acidobacteriota bacterium]
MLQLVGDGSDHPILGRACLDPHPDMPLRRISFDVRHAGSKPPLAAEAELHSDDHVRAVNDLDQIAKRRGPPVPLRYQPPPLGIGRLEAHEL